MKVDAKILMDRAISARKIAYAPYSDFRVGAALLAENGDIFTGCNVENAAYSVTCCAERIAFFKAVSEGVHRFTAIAVVGGSNDVILDNCHPCGVCRQMMAEFCGDDFIVIVGVDTDNWKVHTLGELLPHSFGGKHLEG